MLKNNIAPQKIIFNRRLRVKIERKMTLIIGARCKDGVVIVGDRKVTNSLRPFTNKIRKAGQLEIIFTAAGDEALFEEFLTEVERATLWKVNWMQEENEKLSESLKRAFTATDFKRTCVETMTAMKEVYAARRIDSSDLQVLFSVPETKDGKATVTLYYMDPSDCFPYPQEEGKTVAIGYPSHGRIFLKNLDDHSNNLSMQEVARIAAFTIKYIEQAKLVENDSVGVGNQEPQIWFVYDGKFPSEIIGDELTKLLEGINEQVINIRNQIMFIK